MEVKITKENFESEVLQSKIPVLVDFWATWCPPCRMLAPIIQQLDEKKQGSIKIGKVNIDEEQELAVKFEVDSIPTIYVFKDGKVANHSVGLQPLEELERLLD